MKKLKRTAEEIDAYANEMSNLARKGQYRQALLITKKLLRKFPDDFVLQANYGRMLGDWADDLPLKRRKLMKAEAARSLRPLTRKLAGVPMLRRFGICVNYYYQSYAFRALYAYGKRFSDQDQKLGLYAMGLGASLLAEELYLQGRSAPAKTWALKSNRAWKKYDFKGEAYYFPFYCYALSLLVSGDARGSWVQLKHAAEVSQRKVTSKEFSQLYKMIQTKL